MSDEPPTHLTKLNAQPDQCRKQRVRTPDELRTLIQETQETPEPYGVTGP